MRNRTREGNADKIHEKGSGDIQIQVRHMGLREVERREEEGGKTEMGRIRHQQEMEKNPVVTDLW